MADRNPNIAFLLEHLDRLREQYQIGQELCDQDLFPLQGLPETTPEEERCARIADKHGFDGRLFVIYLLLIISHKY